MGSDWKRVNFDATILLLAYVIGRVFLVTSCILIGKDPDAGKDWRQKEKGTTEDEMVGWVETSPPISHQTAVPKAQMTKTSNFDSWNRMKYRCPFSREPHLHSPLNCVWAIANWKNRKRYPWCILTWKLWPRPFTRQERLCCDLKGDPA